jgi:hypothetical protein
MTGGNNEIQVEIIRKVACALSDAVSYIAAHLWTPPERRVFHCGQK